MSRIGGCQKGLGLRIQGLAFRVQGLGLRLKRVYIGLTCPNSLLRAIKLGVQGLVFKVYCLKYLKPYYTGTTRTIILTTFHMRDICGVMYVDTMGLLFGLKDVRSLCFVSEDVAIQSKSSWKSYFDRDPAQVAFRFLGCGAQALSLLPSRKRLLFQYTLMYPYISLYD